jgi:hypothetical protein
MSVEVGSGIEIGSGITIGDVVAYNTEFITEDGVYYFITEDGQTLIEEQ